MNNPVAKHAHKFNKAATHRDRKNDYKRKPKHKKGWDYSQPFASNKETDMGFEPTDKIKSGRVIANLLNGLTIQLDGYFDVQHVGYADSTDEFVLTRANGDIVIIGRDSLGMADWDEDHNDQPLYVVQDNMDVTHILKFYRNDSLEIMRQVKELF